MDKDKKSWHKDEEIESPPLHHEAEKTSIFRKLNWPNLLELRLSAAQQLGRRSGIGGSDANIIFSGDHERIVGLWLEKRGESATMDLSHKLPVILGTWTESFNRQWYEKISGNRVGRIGESITCAENKWRRCTLDGFVEENAAVWEAKHTSAFSTADQVLKRYMPQLQHNMAVARVERATLSVIFGNHKFEIIEVASDWIYQLELLDAESEFWCSVVTGQEPRRFKVPEPPRPVGSREVCMEGNNRWAAAAADWLEHKEAAKKHSAACSDLRDLVEIDATCAFGHGVKAKRNKLGAITIRGLA